MDETRQGSAVPLLCLNQQKHTRMENFKTFYIVVNDHGRWGKALSLKDAMKNCGVNLKSNFLIYQCLLRAETSQEQLENIAKCFNVNRWGGVELYNNPSEDDSAMVNNQVMGWVTNEDFFK